MRLRPALFTVHLWLGLAAGACIFILGVTGAIMAFEPELQELAHPRLFHAASRGPALPLTALGDIVLAKYPQDALRSFQVPSRPGFTAQVSTNHRVVYLDPATGDIRGATQNVSPVLAFIHAVHTHLALPRMRGNPGSTLQSAATLLMLLMLASGVYLWWPFKRLSVRWGAGRRTWFDLHNSAGVLALPLMLILAGSGVILGYENITFPLLYKVTGSTPVPRPDARIAARPGVPVIGPDSAMALARRAVPGATPFLIGLPGRGGAYDIRARFPEDRTPGGRSYVTVDPYSGAVLFAQASRTAPAGARLAVLNRALHTGDVVGIPSKIVMSLGSLLVASQVVTGVFMWWKRRRRAGAANAESLTGVSTAA